jgi:tetratricopeptide (TPR) repeat protein
MGAAPTLARLLEAKGPRRRALARSLVSQDDAWERLHEGLRDSMLQAPERAERAAHDLEAAAYARNDKTLAARLRLVRGASLHRAGSPVAASRLLLDAAPTLFAAGDHARASQSLLLAVDALAHAGELDAALQCAERAKQRIRGPGAPRLRAALRANRANVLRLLGRLDEAAQECDAAARAFDRLGEAPSAAGCRLNAGVALLYAGHVRQARRRLERAHAVYKAAGHADAELHAAYNLAWCDARAGDLGAGIPALEKLAEQFAARHLQRREALCRMDLADALRRAGDMASAAREAERAAEGFRQAGAGAEEVEALWLLAAARAVDDPAAAARALTRTTVLAKRLGRPEFELRARVLQQDLALRRGAAVDGRALAQVERRAQALGQDEIAWQAALLRAEGALARGRVTDAARRVRALPTAMRRHPWGRVAADTVRARVALRAGDTGSGIRRLRALAARLTQMRGTLPGGWLRTTFLLNRLDPHLLLVDALLSRGRAADRREAEGLLDDMALRRFLSSKPPSRSKGRVASLRERLERLYDRLADGGSATRGLHPAQRVTLLGEVRGLEREIADAWRREERGARREHAAHPVGMHPAGTHYVHVWRGPAGVRALRRQGSQVHDAGVLVSADGLRKHCVELQFHAHRVRATGSASATRALDRRLAMLSDLLLTPLGLTREAPAGGLRLVLDARLPDVPWELLPTDSGPLAAAMPMARVPAARLPARHRLRGRGTRVIVSDERALPAIEREARHVGERGEVLRGPGASLAAARDALRSCRTVHFAMHGVAAPHAPALGGVRLFDGWFTAGHLPARVAADLVSLAACQTGAPPGPAAQAWGALPHALLRAGARWVLWTAGDVDDETTADLMSEFHPVSDLDRVPERLGRALATLIGRQGSAARLLPFRLSGGRA